MSARILSYRHGRGESVAAPVSPVGASEHTPASANGCDATGKQAGCSPSSQSGATTISLPQVGPVPAKEKPE